MDDNVSDFAFTSDLPMRSLIDRNSLLLLVISRFGIPLGFGDDSVEAVCKAQNVDCGTFLTVANFIDGHKYDAARVDLHSLVTYLKGAHSYFLDYFLPAIGRKLFDVVGYGGDSEVGALLMRYYDEYVCEMRRHAGYENEVLFGYVEALCDGRCVKSRPFDFMQASHADMTLRLRNLKNIIIRCYPSRNGDTLNSVLLDLIACEQDLESHCRIEDSLLLPNVRRLEESLQSDSTEACGMEAGPVADDVSARLESLTGRERDVVVCVAKGLANKEIADRLCLSVHTVTTYRHSISVKLDIHSAAGLAVFAIISKLVDISDIKPI